MTAMTAQELLARQQIARDLLSSGRDEIDLELMPDLTLLPANVALTSDLQIAFPEGLAPVPQPLLAPPDPTAELPTADVLVVTWTVDEQDALADVLTPGQGRKAWYRYSRRYESHYAPLIRPGAPAKQAKRLGSWMLTKIGDKSVLCYKSELHLNQDGIRDGVAPGEATLPVKDMFEQLIKEISPKVVITVGTSGGLFLEHDLGDVAVTRGAKFRLSSEFKNAPYNNKTFKSEWDISTQHFPKAVELMQIFAPNLKEPPLNAPTARHTGLPFTAPTYIPDIKLDGENGIPGFHPILTTDFFEFGTSTNGLEDEGMAVEMGDAVLGLVASEMLSPPKWVAVRNLSDPQINGDLVRPLQVSYAVWYYKEYGYWTSVMSSLATWAIIAGLD
jgi:hypothetical protein